MIRINLLPPEAQPSTEFKLNPSYVVGGVAAALIVLLLPFTWVQISRRQHLRDDIAVVKDKLERFKPIVAQVELLEQAKAQLEQRKGIIQTLENERLRYPFFMEDFIKLLPNNVWLTNLTTTLPPDNQTISVGMDIIALDHYAVADMVSNLETSQIFSDIDVGPITLSQSGPTGTGQSITFHINSIYRKGTPINAIKKP
jgi:Tfp pilus assembly protein PilN